MNNRETQKNTDNLQKNNKRKSSFIGRFFKTLFIVLAIAAIIGAGVVVGYGYMMGDSKDVKDMAKAIDSNLKDVANLGGIFEGIKENTNFVLLGTDGDGGETARTDTIMVGTYNSKTNKITLISVPRDTFVIMPKDRRDVLKTQGLWTPSDGEMKINEISHHAGDKYNVTFLVKQLEEMMGTKIEFYAKIDLDAFKFLVDEIGGVEFDVPQRMYYNDPEQNLFIDLKAGVQTLNGTQAEGLVRYRRADEKNPISNGYPEGDLQRVRVQQDFIKAVLNKLLSSGVSSNLDTMLKTVTKYVKTNFPLTDAPKYVSSLKKINAESIATHTLPGEPKTINGKSYFLVDDAALKEIITAEGFNSSTGFAASQSDKADIPSIDKRVQVLNGGFVKGIAGKTQEKLKAEGFKVGSIGDFEGEKKPHTRIMVKAEGMGKDLMAYFPNAEIIADKNQKDFDIIIILGTEEK